MMTVATIQTELTRMKTMIEGNRLGRLVANASVFGSGVIGDPSGYCAPNHSDGYDKLDRNKICPPRKDISHWELPTSSKRGRDRFE